MAVYFSPVGNGFQWLGQTALVLSGGKINTYKAGTTTPQATFTDSTGTIQNANPIILDSTGRYAQEIWFTGGQTYKFVVTDALGVIQFTLDNLYGIGDPAAPNAATTALSGVNALYNPNIDAALNAGPLALPLINGGYSTIDQWLIFQNNVSAGKSAQVASDVLGYRYYLKMGRNNASASTDSIIAQQALRSNDSIPYQGKQVVFSFYAKAGANFSGTNLNVSLFSGTGIDQDVSIMAGWTGATTPIATLSPTITTTGTQYSFIGTLPTNSTQIGVRIYFNPTGTAGADDNVYLTGFKLELGTIPTPRDKSQYLDVVTSFRSPNVCGGVMSNFGTGSLGTGDPFTQCHFLSKNGNTVLINGVPEIIPAGAISVSGGVQATYTSTSVDKVLSTSLSSGNLYFIYVYMLNGVMTLDFSLTAYVQHPVYGYPVKSSDSTCTLVGLCFIQNTYTFTLTGGSGYSTPGRYRNVVLTGGTGSNATADITVAGGAVTVVSINHLSDPGTKYTNGDSLTTADANIGGRVGGSAFSITIANSALTTFGGARGQNITSYYNRFVQRLETAVNASSSATTNAFASARLDDAITNLANGERSNNFLEWVQWFDQAPLVHAMANAGTNAAGVIINFSTSITNGLGQTDAINGFTSSTLSIGAGGTPNIVVSENDPHDATGYYRAWALGWSPNPTTFSGLMFADGVTS